MATTTHLRKRASIPLFITTVGGSLLLGMLSGLFSGSKAGYKALVLPPATPPDAVFPIVWSILYVMIGMALFFVLHRPATTPILEHDRKAASTLWYIQFAFNLAWSFAFFTFKLYTFSFIWLAALVAVNLAAIIYSFRVSKLAGALLIPYQAWLMFALYLNMFIAILN